MLLGAAAFTTVEIAARLVGVAPSSVYDLRKRNPEFEERWQASHARRIVAWEISMDVVASNPRNPRCVDAAKFMLGSHKPAVYKQRSELEVTAPVETIEIVKAAAAFMREQRRLGTPTAEIVPEELADGDENGRGDATAIVRAMDGNGNGSGG